MHARGRSISRACVLHVCLRRAFLLAQRGLGDGLGLGAGGLGEGAGLGVGPGVGPGVGVGLGFGAGLGPGVGVGGICSGSASVAANALRTGVTAARGIAAAATSVNMANQFFVFIGCSCAMAKIGSRGLPACHRIVRTRRERPTERRYGADRGLQCCNPWVRGGVVSMFAFCAAPRGPR